MYNEPANKKELKTMETASEKAVVSSEIPPTT